MTGAPPTKFSKPYQLPKQPWGTEADNDFLSLEAVPDATGKKMDLTAETLAHDSSLPFLRRFHGAEPVSDDELRRAKNYLLGRYDEAVAGAWFLAEPIPADGQAAARMRR